MEGGSFCLHPQLINRFQISRKSSIKILFRHISAKQLSATSQPGTEAATAEDEEKENIFEQKLFGHFRPNFRTDPRGRLPHLRHHLLRQLLGLKVILCKNYYQNVLACYVYKWDTSQDTFPNKTLKPWIVGIRTDGLFSLWDDCSNRSTSCATAQSAHILSHTHLAF